MIHDEKPADLEMTANSVFLRSRCVLYKYNIPRTYRSLEMNRLIMFMCTIWTYAAFVSIIKRKLYKRLRGISPKIYIPTARTKERRG